MTKIACIASDATPLWECPCRECTKLDWEAADGLDGRPSLRQWRKDNWPEFYDA